VVDLLPIKQITIIGTGLIGASFALALRKYGFAGRIVGCDRAPVLERAAQMRLLDAALADPAEAIRGSDLVLLATPVGAIIDLIERLGPLLPQTALLTDVGSTKAEIMARARAVFGSAAGERFLGGHPMAGKEHGGIEHADAGLFRDAAWLLTPCESQQLSGGIHGGFIALLKSIGARVVPLEAQQHDLLCAWASHVPQMMATALAGSLLDEFADGEGIQPLREIDGRVLRAMTRIAASPYSMWRDIALTNAPNIEAALLRLEQRLAHIREHLRDAALREEFEQANRLAAELTPPSTGKPK
jgi:prephenate dehydrogenase